MKHKIIDDIEAALKSKDAIAMRKLSTLATEEALLTQNQEMADLAVASYALNKILSKIHLRDEVDELYQAVAPHLEEEDMGAVIDHIREYDNKHGFFHGDIIEKARIKIGTRLYSHGLSVAQSAHLTKSRGHTIQKFAGETKIFEHGETKTVRERLEDARKMIR